MRIVNCIVCNVSFSAAARNRLLCSDDACRKARGREHYRRYAEDPTFRQRSRESSRKYVKTHKDFCAERNRKWRDANQEWLRVWNRDYRRKQRAILDAVKELGLINIGDLK